MRRTTEDKTLERNYQQKWQFLISEYEAVKARSHVRFRFVSDFFKHHGTSKQTFFKYYNRYLQIKMSGGDIDPKVALLPLKRGPRWKQRRPDVLIEQAVMDERIKGLNKYEICAILRPRFQDKTPSPSGVYNILRREKLNILTPKTKETKRKIMKEKAGELGHLDCHYLSKDMIVESKQRYYLVCIIDDCTRIAWAEVVEDIKSLTVMFATLKSINLIKQSFDIQFSEVMTDNGSEFASRNNKQGHPVERMMVELGIKHRYTRPYRPQTNGKIERFWRTLNEDLIDGTTFQNIDEFKKELIEYLIYYNYNRPHQSLNGLPPIKFLQNLSTN